LLVAGDLTRDEGLSLSLEAGAALALLVEGNVSIVGEIALGSDDASVNLFVGGSGNIHLRGGGELHGVLYAPEAELVLDAPLTVYGAIFVERVAATAPLTIMR
jgi:hypothetical protein